MKKGIVISILCITASLIGNSVYADDKEIKPIKLKSKCIKQYPLAANQTDHALLDIYQQACDKDNASRLNDLLAQAAMRMYELKQPMNALKLATQLQEQNVRGATLTDVTFLASVDVANQALQHMRSTEMRYLSNELTYPPAKQLSDSIRAAVPAPDTSTSKAITDESVKREVRNTSTNNTTRRTTNRKVRTTQPTRSTVNQTTAPAKRQTAVAPTVTKQPNTVQKTGSNPFDSLK
ncbi:hypothetical protein F909_01815 [Acinetobacter sp. ANC 3929]|uniref:hypothetical protein n=1 Tax=unclassified Acinetobacter TaxID=196816 RepID=UPI0002D1146D|nr:MULTISPECIES: hypothetical protein [unclassified Acinetobacter]ENW80529.1 hypothetical protein F909_01815 [Acinetobacter sp. ANC 3929]MCH7352829.1 hypothetical protein [Acinetobacter sp. NIPH 2023]MCH7354010.1 hypothetical protein [Acinetobacter sp. NIPH 1958]MCH7360486.1 hypothetical protein [Acinetobacter sp. NIPH 2024]